MASTAAQPAAQVIAGQLILDKAYAFAQEAKRQWQRYAAFVEQAATMLPKEPIAAIWRKVEAATQKEAEASGVA